jgi:hypothetical protein
MQQGEYGRNTADIRTPWDRGTDSNLLLVTVTDLLLVVYGRGRERRGGKARLGVERIDEWGEKPRYA